MVQLIALLGQFSFAQDATCSSYDTYTQQMYASIKAKCETITSLTLPKETNSKKSPITNLKDLSKKCDAAVKTDDANLEQSITDVLSVSVPMAELTTLDLVQYRIVNDFYSSPVDACKAWQEFQKAIKDQPDKCRTIDDRFINTLFGLDVKTCPVVEVPSVVEEQPAPKPVVEKEEVPVQDNKPQDANQSASNDSAGDMTSIIAMILAIVTLIGMGVLIKLGVSKMSVLEKKLAEANEQMKQLEEKLLQCTTKQQLVDATVQKLTSEIQKVAQDIVRIQQSAASVQSVASQNITVTPEEENPSVKRGGLKLGGKKEVEPMESTPYVEPMVTYFRHLLELWHGNLQVCQQLPNYQRFESRFIQNSAKYQEMLNIASFTEKELDAFIFPLLDLMVRFESEFIHLNLQSGGQLQNQVNTIHNIVYNGFGAEIEKNKLGKLIEVIPMSHAVDTNYQTVIDSRNVTGPFKGKVVELWKIPMMNMSGMKLVRRAEVISGS